MTAPVKLTRNQALVLERLEASDAPLSAYTILEDLRKEGFKAPLQVYRALEKLIAVGEVHRIESLNAFIICRHSGCSNKNATLFAICDQCGSAKELGDHQFTEQLSEMAEKHKFDMHKAVVEISGVCDACR